MDDAWSKTRRRSVNIDSHFNNGKSMTLHPDPYIRYTHKFFKKWLPVYDLFASSIFYVYDKAVKCAELKTGESVLDICTGTGEIARRCAKRGAKVTGIDITPDMLNKARRKCKNSDAVFEVMDARDLKFKDSSFDVSIISLALHDMPRHVRLQVLKEAVRVTRNRIIIVDYDCPRSSSLSYPLYEFVRWFESPYFQNYSFEGLKPLLHRLDNAGDWRLKKIWPIFAVFVLERMRVIK